jgi:hypothetical protein
MEPLGDHRAVGHDIEFISLDMTNSCAIRCFRSSQRTILIFGQWSDMDGDQNEALITGIRRSLEEMDV